LIIIGCNTFFSSLFISTMSMEKPEDTKLVAFTADKAVYVKESPGIDAVAEPPIATSSLE